jgi:hypothetical protein
MPRAKVEPAEVTTRRIGPQLIEGTSEETDLEGHLHQPVQQLDHFPPKFDVEYIWYTPETAVLELEKAERAEQFKQRPIRPAQVRRWKNLIRSERMVHFLPASPICYDPEGVQLNGQHRFRGLTQCPEGTEAGFMVIRNVPRWMFAFFDTNSIRTLKDVYAIGGRAFGPQTPSAMKLAMRYEEYLLGMRNPGGWRHWFIVKDEHSDVDEFTARRGEIQDWYDAAEKVKKGSRILQPASMSFAFYQSLAWPEGDDLIYEFFDMLRGVHPNLSPQHPARLLRDWSNTAYMNHESVQAKRETHLFLLLRVFAMVQRNTRLDKLVWAYGMPMALPYHPDGPEKAIANVQQALKDIDEEYES